MRHTVALDRLKRISILVPVIVLGMIELVREWLFPDFFHSWPGYPAMLLILLAGIALFSRNVFAIVEASQSAEQQRNHELLALHHASLAIETELDLKMVLQRLVDEARGLLSVKYGGVTFLRDDGEIAEFVTSGVSDDIAARIGTPPKGHGVIGVVTSTGQILRMDDVSAHPDSVGFPEHHPPMVPLLAVPIRSRGRVLGHLYLADETGVTFSEADEETLTRFAALATVAIENAMLHQQVRTLAITEERERIAREMHDSLAQVLGYVNTKVQAAQVLLESNQTEKALNQLSQMATAARSAYADVREGILSLRTSLDADRRLTDTLRDYLDVWEEQNDVAVELRIAENAEKRLSDLAEVQLLRIIQEALANVRKHAGASSVEISMCMDGHYVVTEIRDNGAGFDPGDRGYRSVPQFGLSTMRERTESLGGSFTVTSVPGEGTCLRVRLKVER